MDVRVQTRMAGCFYSFLIGVLLLQAAQQFGGMLMTLKSHCKEGFWRVDFITSEVTISSFFHLNG